MTLPTRIPAASPASSTSSRKRARSGGRGRARARAQHNDLSPNEEYDRDTEIDEDPSAVQPVIPLRLEVDRTRARIAQPLAYAASPPFRVDAGRQQHQLEPVLPVRIRQGPAVAARAEREEEDEAKASASDQQPLEQPEPYASDEEEQPLDQDSSGPHQLQEQDAGHPLPVPGAPHMLQPDPDGDMRPPPVYVYRDLDPQSGADAKLDEEDEDDLLRFNRASDKRWCFLCVMRESPAALEGHPGLQRLHRIRLENYGMVSMECLAQMMQDHYNRELRPCIEPEEDRRPWFKRTIVQHVEEHARDRLTDIVSNLRAVRGVVTLLKQSIKMCNADDPSDVKINAANVKLLENMVKLSQRLGADAEHLSTSQKERH
jgi:hypothetical protein